MIFGLAGRYGDVILTKTKPTDKLGIFESLSSSCNDSTFKTFCCNGLCDEEVNCENVSKFPREHDSWISSTKIIKVVEKDLGFYSELFNKFLFHITNLLCEKL